MQSEGFEPAIPAISRLHTYTLDRTATGSEQKELRRPEFDPLSTYPKLFHHLPYIYCNIIKFLILCQISLEASRYQLASTEAAPSDVTATILLPVSPAQKLHDVFGRDRVWNFGPDTVCSNWITAWFSSVPPIIYPGSASHNATPSLSVPSFCHFILRKPNDSLKKPRLKVQPYYGVTVGRHLQLLRNFSLSVRQNLHVCYFNLLQHSDLYMYSLV